MLFLFLLCKAVWNGHVCTILLTHSTTVCLLSDILLHVAVFFIYFYLPCYLLQNANGDIGIARFLLGIMHFGVVSLLKGRGCRGFEQNFFSLACLCIMLIVAGLKSVYMSQRTNCCSVNEKLANTKTDVLSC